MKLLLPFLMSAFSAASMAQSQSPVSEAPSGAQLPITTEENLMDHEYIPIGSLMPLTGLICDGHAK